MNAPRWVVTLSLAALVAASFARSPDASAHGDHGDHEAKKVKKKPATSKFSLALGVSVSKGIGTPSSSEAGSGAAPSEDHSGHQMLALHGGAEDGDSGAAAPASGGASSGGGSTAAPAFDPTFTARGDYAFTKKMGLGLSIGFGISSGVLDPELGPTLKLPFGPKLSVNSALTATIPVSKASRDMYKTTTIKVTSGPTYTSGKISLGVSAIVAYAWYSKTVIVDDAPATKAASLQRPERSARPGLLLHGGADDGDAGGAGAPPAGFNGPSGDNLASSDREFSRYGLRSNFGYQFAKRFRSDSSLGAAMINHQFGASTWSTDATIAQISFSVANLTAYLAFAVSKSTPSPALPTDPNVSVGAGYLFK